MTDDTSQMQEVFELAECLARLGGYRNFSIRRLADRTGVRSSSIYDRFGSKEQLAIAIIRRFGERVSDRIGAADDPKMSPDQKMATFIDVYRQSITDDGQLCLYLVFGSELHILPSSVQQEVKSFYANIFSWLETLLLRFPEYGPSSGRDARRAAQAIVAALNGAQVCVRAASDKSLFEVIVNQQYASGLIPGKNPEIQRKPKG